MGKEIEEPFEKSLLVLMNKGVNKCRKKIHKDIVPSEEMKAFLKKHKVSVPKKGKGRKHDGVW